MKHPLFHLDEEARVGIYATNKSIRGRACTIRAVLKPVEGENRYRIRTLSGEYSIVLESTLRKTFERGRWSDCAWQPRWEAR